MGLITKNCKCCKARYIVNRQISKKIKDKEFKNYCLTCWLTKDIENCRQARRKALGLIP